MNFRAKAGSCARNEVRGKKGKERSSDEQAKATSTTTHTQVNSFSLQYFNQHNERRRNSRGKKDVPIIILNRLAFLGEERVGRVWLIARNKRN